MATQPPELKREVGETTFTSVKLSCVLIEQGDTGTRIRLGGRECNELYALLHDMQMRRTTENLKAEYMKGHIPVDTP